MTLRGGDFIVRGFAAEDAPAGDAILRAAFAGSESEYPEAAEAAARGLALLAQTGHRLLVADAGRRLAAVARWRAEDGIATIDLLASGIPGAGRALLRGVERTLQEHGIRYARIAAPDGTLLEDLFRRHGYTPVGRAPAVSGGPLMVTMERRLPLLTVREQRREDADAIAALTGEDPWPFTQGRRPGWFVLADGDRVVGAVSVRENGRGLARVRPPVVAPGYAGRGLEVWMAERAALHAETDGALTVALDATPALEHLRRAFEDRRWFLEGQTFVKHTAAHPPAAEDDTAWR
ncbi:MAG: hypothetical protein U0547_07225 [Dehalococcoidia bacterium]